MDASGLARAVSSVAACFFTAVLLRLRLSAAAAAGGFSAAFSGFVLRDFQSGR